MKFLDRLAFNRLVKIIADFIVAILKIFAPSIKELDTQPLEPIVPSAPKPNRNKILPLRKKDITNENNN